MREILFRGKRVDNGEWVEGLPYERKTVDCIRTSELLADFIAHATYIIIPETFGQYTGLTDKNGKKIFEGDIVRARFKSNHSQYTFKIVFHAGMFLFDNGCVRVTSLDVFGITIIGNIHDNPELKGGEG